jgi:hypothetical protein
VFYSCTDNKRIDVIDASYIIDLDNTEKQDTINLSCIFSKVNTVILEDHDDAIIGDVSAIQIFDNYIFVLDRLKAKKLFVFDKTGKYVKQIGSIGIGPGEYLEVIDFCINAKNREIYLVDSRGKKIHKYNFDSGVYLGSIKLPHDITYKYIVYHEDEIYLSMCAYDENKRDNMLIMKINPEKDKYEECLSSDHNAGQNSLLFTLWNFFVSKSNSIKYAGLFMNTVFSIENGNIYPYLSIKYKDWVKKEDMLSKEEIENMKKTGHIDQTDVQRKKGKAFIIHNYMEWEDNIYLEYYCGWNDFPVLYNRKTGKTNHYKAFKNDILLNRGTKNNIFIFVNSNAAYDWDPYFITSLKNNKIELAFDVDKREELMNLDEERVVIFEYVFK